MSSRLNKIGHIGRPRGLDGWVRFLPFNTRAASLITENLILYINNGMSGYRPLRIIDWYTEEKRNTVSFFVKFDVITNRTKAESIKDKAIYSDQFDPDDEHEYSDQPGKDDITGYKIVDGENEVGSVLDLLQNPAHQIIEAKIGLGSMLIPFVDEYVLNIDHEDRIVECQNIDQLTDL